MFLGTLKKGKKIDGFLKNNLFQPRLLYQRHEDIKQEMINRGYKHASPMCEVECGCVLDLPQEKQYWEIDKEKALEDLLSRCPECHKRFTSLQFSESDSPRS
jgi:hypothetical protein